MIYFSKDADLTVEYLQKIIEYFTTNCQPQLTKYKNYYDGIQSILNKHFTDSTKPCNKLVINYCFNIATAYCGYLGSPGFISYSSDNDIEDIMDILRYNDYQAADADFLMDALIYGVANELMYIDSDSQTRFRLINPTMSFGIFDDTLTEDLIYFVRMYKRNQWDDSDIYSVDVYDNALIKHYRMEGMAGKLTYEYEEPHYFNQCPANIFYMPDEKSVFDCVLTLQDAINTLLSSETDGFEAFVEAYLALYGVEADADDIAAMKEDRVLCLPKDAKAEYLTKNINDTQIENILTRIHDSIYRIAQCPDFSSESFVGGVSSGVAIAYRLTGMETRAGKIEAEMKKALQRRVEIICGMSALRLGEYVFRDININFKRNIPADVNSTISLINSLQGIVSDATLLSQLDFIPDVNAELERLAEQRAANLSLYSFGNENSLDEND